MKPPSRAVRLTLKLEADTREGLVGALHDIASLVERGEMTKGVSGGPSSGWIYELVVNEEPSHDEYFAQVRAYLEHLETAPDQEGETS